MASKPETAWSHLCSSSVSLISLWCPVLSLPFAEGRFFHSSALTFTRGKKKTPNLTSILSTASCKSWGFLSVSTFIPIIGTALYRLSWSKTPKENPVFTEQVYMARCGHMINPIWISVSAPKSSAPGFESTAQSQAAYLCLQDSRPSHLVILDPLLPLTGVVSLPSWEPQM